jgi:hypothetical protein
MPNLSPFSCLATGFRDEWGDELYYLVAFAFRADCLLFIVFGYTL